MAVTENRIQLSHIFQQFNEGSRQPYDDFLKMLSLNSNMSDEKYFDETMLCNYFKDLEIYTPGLNHEYSKLFFELLKFDWLDLGTEATDAYKSLILNILSAHTGEYLNISLHCLVKRFKPAITFKTDNMGLLDSEEKIKLNDKLKFSKIHHLIGSISQIVPSTPLHLEQVILEECPPTQFSTSYSLECYIQNLFCITLYLPTSRHYIFKIIVKMLIELDTSVNRSVINDFLAKQQLAVTPLDAFIEMDQITNNNTLKEATILDKLLLICFQHIQYCCYTNDKFDLVSSKLLFSELLLIFDILLLPTQTTHTQFIYFFSSSFHPDLYQMFCNHLWKKIESVNIETMYRQSAAIYIGSFICRANYITIYQVKSELCHMRDWILRYIANCNDLFTSCDHRHHGPFYALCQSFFYVIVFRHKELLESHMGHKFCLSLNLQKIILSQLNPLKFCLQSIANVFCSVVRSNQIAVCDTILEKNKRTHQQEFGDYNEENIPFIFSHFPFDPFLLNESAVFIKDLYRDYDDSILQEQETLSDHNEEYELMDSEQFSLSHSLTKNKTLFCEKFSPAVMDFLSYGTSPGFQHL